VVCCVQIDNPIICTTAHPTEGTSVVLSKRYLQFYMEDLEFVARRVSFVQKESKSETKTVIERGQTDWKQNFT
jgi:hypothetical protein